MAAISHTEIAKRSPGAASARTDHAQREAEQPGVDTFLSEPQVRAAIGIKARSSLRNMIANGKFPRPVKLSERRVAWPSSEVRAWQKQRIAERDAQQA